MFHISPGLEAGCHVIAVTLGSCVDDSKIKRFYPKRDQSCWKGNKRLDQINGGLFRAC